MSSTSDNTGSALVKFIAEHARETRKPTIEASVIQAELDRHFEISKIALTAVYQAAHYGNVRCIAAVKEIEQIRHRK